MLKESAYFTNKRISQMFKSAFQITIPQLENVVAVFLKRNSTRKKLRENINQVPGLWYKKGPNKLNVRIQDISKNK